nr:IS5 family transposase [Pseudonocardia sp. ICBG601]
MSPIVAALEGLEVGPDAGRAAPVGEAAGLSLVEALSRVPDPRKPRGVRHGVLAVLLLGACAVLAGARSFTAIAEYAHDVGRAVLDVLGVGAVAPHESTIRRVLQRVDASALEAALQSWVLPQLRACLEMVGVSGWSTRLGCSIVVGMQERPRRYPSDTSDAQWVVIEPLLPPLARRGRPVAHARRDVLDAILYVVRTGCAWRALPVDFPPWQTVYWYFNQWEQQKVTEKILPVVRGQLRIAEGRDPEPSAGIIDSQSVKGADTVGQDSRGYDAGKKTGGRKRFIVTDTLGLLLTTMVCSASVQDRDGAKPILLNLYLRTRVRFVYADAGFAGRLLDWAATILQTTIEIIRKPPEQRGFTVLPRRWVVERTLAWLTAHRRLARDYERHPTTSEAMIRWAAINTITRRIARGYPATRQQKHTTPSTH